MPQRHHRAPDEGGQGLLAAWSSTPTASGSWAGRSTGAARPPSSTTRCRWRADHDRRDWGLSSVRITAACGQFTSWGFSELIRTGGLVHICSLGMAILHGDVGPAVTSRLRPFASLKGMPVGKSWRTRHTVSKNSGHTSRRFHLLSGSVARSSQWIHLRSRRGGPSLLLPEMLPNNRTRMRCPLLVWVSTATATLDVNPDTALGHQKYSRTAYPDRSARTPEKELPGVRARVPSKLLSKCPQRQARGPLRLLAPTTWLAPSAHLQVLPQRQAQVRTPDSQTCVHLSLVGRREAFPPAVTSAAGGLIRSQLPCRSSREGRRMSRVQPAMMMSDSPSM